MVDPKESIRDKNLKARPERSALGLPMPDDFHLHLRQGEAMVLYARREALSFGRALVMPNTLPPIASSESISIYKKQILAALSEGSGFEPLMSFKLLPGMSAEDLRACAEAGAIAGKYYPSGATTNAADGPRSPDEVSEALDAMEESGIVLCIHGEDPEAPSLGREIAFLRQVEGIMTRWPRLKIVLEHLSTAEAAAFVASGPPRLAATLTAHHLLYTIDDMLGGSLNPHIFCKPILKSAADRRALRLAAFSGSPKFFFGSDSAPHPRNRKESASAPGGVYSAPTAIPALAGLFEAEGTLAALPGFLAQFGAAFYGLASPSGYIELLKCDWVVPGEIDGVVPMCAGEKLAWNFA
ncbi:MAG: dihydroorotase [Spirochaetes bacterium]|nr:dihydroorotase [Spirochaetota bacterium]